MGGANIRTKNRVLVDIKPAKARKEAPTSEYTTNGLLFASTPGVAKCFAIAAPNSFRRDLPVD
jgi:hypothetical protein